MSRNFGHAVGMPARPNSTPDLSTSQGLIDHSLQHGELATLSAVAERGALVNAPKQSVMVINGPNGERAVARTDDVERFRKRPLTRREIDQKWANEQFLRDTNPNRQPPGNEPIRRVDVGKRSWSKR